jgi:hypothetical protein
MDRNLNQGNVVSVMCSPILIVYGYSGYIRGYTYLKFIKFSGESNIVSYITLIIGLVILLYFILKVYLLCRIILMVKSIFLSHYFLFLVLSVVSVNLIYKLNTDLYIFSFILSLVSAFSTGRMVKSINDLY